jgi:hypothetical protein
MISFDKLVLLNLEGSPDAPYMLVAFSLTNLVALTTTHSPSRLIARLGSRVKYCLALHR